MTVATFTPRASNNLALMLTGGGARAAYQVGQLKALARHFPHLRFSIITGVSAGGINAACLAALEGTLADKVAAMEKIWSALECRDVFHFNLRSLLPFRSAIGSLLPKGRRRFRPRSLVDTAPLGELLCKLFRTRPRQPIESIERNIRSGDLDSVALMGLDYSTGQNVRWVQGRHVETHEGPNRRTEEVRLTVEHVLASASLPFVFPAVRIGDNWYGDGGIRLAAPLSPALHLGAGRILAMATGYQRTPDEVARPVVVGYPPAAQILGQLVNAIFLDAIDEDVARMERISEMLRKLHPVEREGYKAVDLLVLRPSQDLGRLAGAFEHYLPLNVKLVTRALGARETETPDAVSMLMFEPHYMTHLITLGEADIDARVEEIRAFLGEVDGSRFPVDGAALG